MKSKSDLYQFLKISLIFSILSILDCFFYANKTFMYCLAAFQVVFLLYLLVRKKYTLYYCFYCGFLALSLEFEEFVGSNFYGLKSIRLLGINIGTLLIIPLFLCLLFDSRKFIKKSLVFDSFFRTFIAFFVFALISGGLNFIFNDNGIREVASIRNYIEAIYPYMFIFLCFSSLFLLFKKGYLDFSIFENTLFSIIVATSVTMCFSLIFKNYGVYGGIETLQVTTLSMTLPCAIIVFAYSNIEKRKKIIVFIAAVLITILSLLFNANGKIVLSLGISILFLLYICFRKNKTVFFSLLLILPLVVYGGLFALGKMTSTSLLLKIKVEQALSTISFWKPDWFENMSDSPKFRIEEFLTILDEYAKKPWSIIFGKGFLGTTKDNLGYYITASQTTFSDFELKNGLYYNMHESLNNLFLTGGLFGLFFYLKFLFAGIKSSRVSFWGVLGTFWFALFFRYSITIGVFGISVLALSFLKYDESRKAEVFQKKCVSQNRVLELNG